MQPTTPSGPSGQSASSPGQPPTTAGPANQPLPSPPQIPAHKIVGFIGQGGYGEVWLARDLLGQHCAVKVVRRERFESAKPFEREFDGIRNFWPLSRTHDGFVDILQVGRGDAGDWFYYVMELADAAGTGKQSDGAKENWGSELGPASQSPMTPPLHPSTPSSPHEPASYSPQTLQARIRAEGRLPVDECIRLGLALTSALDHLHRHDLVHRDIKPANIIFVNSQPKLADVGTVAETSETMSWVGTQGYMPPEGPGSVQADLFALGKVLYMACAGHSAHECPNPPTGLDDFPDQRAWLELNEVITRATDPDPKRRYARAAEMQADLALMQAGESPSARRLWKKRLKQAVWAAVGLALLELEKLIRPPHTAGWSSEAWLKASNAAVQFGFDTNLQSQAAASLAGLDAHCLYQTNGIGGSSVAFSPDGNRVLYGALQDTNATKDPGKAHLLDLTTTNLTAFAVPGEGPVAFLPDGTPVQFSTNSARKLGLWRVGQTFLSASSGDFPVARTTNAGQESPANRQAGKPALQPPATPLRCFTLPSGETIGGITALALTPDASFVAASGTNTVGQSFLAAWEGTTGRLLLPVAASRQSAATPSAEDHRRTAEAPLRSQPATALAFTPDGSLLAAGYDSGEVLVWRVLPTSSSSSQREEVHSDSGGGSQSVLTSAATVEGLGRLSPLRIPASRLPIHSLAFCRDYVRDPLHQAPEPQWLLAIGDDAGRVDIWELPRPRLRRACQGGQYQRNALAFSPDGALLVSVGRTPTLIWDTATGNRIASLRFDDYTAGVAFSQTGRKIATASENPGGDSRLGVHALENGRGIQTFRGLSTSALSVCFTSDGSRLAAISQDWQVGFWDAVEGRLLGLFNVPRGLATADNATVALDANGSRLAFMAGTNALLIDAASGCCTQRWTLPPGRVAELVFDPAGRLLAGHYELADPNAGGLPHPKTYRLRELLPGNRYMSLGNLDEFNLDVRGAAWAPDASFIVVAGTQVFGGATNRFVRALSLLGRTNLWTRPQQFQPYASSYFTLDSVAQVVAFACGHKEGIGVLPYLLDAKTGSTNRELPALPHALHSQSDMQAVPTSTGDYALDALSDDTHLVAPILAGSDPAGAPAFSHDGRLLAWGNKDGTVVVCDLHEINRRLRGVRLDWRVLARTR